MQYLNYSVPFKVMSAPINIRMAKATVINVRPSYGEGSYELSDETVYSATYKI